MNPKLESYVQERKRSERLQNRMLHDWAHQPKKCIEQIEAVEWMLRLAPCDSVEDIAAINATRRVLTALKEKCQ